MSQHTAQIVLMLPVLFFSVVLHEIAHAVVAEWGGDKTARLSGRITLNPIAHIDLWGTIIIPGILILSGSSFLIGWAKPVPVNPANLRSRHWGAGVSAAGITVNFFLAFLAAAAMKLFLVLGLVEGMMATPGESVTLSWCAFQVILSFIFINLLLMVFNLIPIPPLDGSHLLGYALGPKVSESPLFLQFRQIGFILLIILLASGYLIKIIGPVMHVFLRGFDIVFQIGFLSLYI